MNTKRVDVHVKLPAWLVREIEEAGFQKSSFLEHAAIQYLLQIRQFEKATDGVGDMEPRAGFEPATGGLQVRRDETQPLRRPISGNTGAQRQNALQSATRKILQYAGDINILQEFETTLREINKKSRTHYMNTLRILDATTLEDIRRKRTRNKVIAVRKFAKFLFDRGLLTQEELTAVLNTYKTEQSNAKLEFYSDNDVKELLQRLAHNQKYYYFVRLVLESGLRRSHAITAFNKIARGEYEDAGGFAEVRLNIMHNTKNAYVCFCSLETARAIHENKLQMSVKTAERIQQRYGVQYNMLRKYFYTKAIEAGVPAEVVDFIQGRTAAGVGAKHYLHKYALAKKYYPHLLEIFTDI